MAEASPGARSHIFLGEGHERNERRTWVVIALCGVMMVAEIVGGLRSVRSRWSPTACICRPMPARCFWRRWPTAMPSVTLMTSVSPIGTGKLGDLAGFTSAIVLAMIAVLIGYEVVMRLFSAGGDPFSPGDSDCRPRTLRQCGQRLACSAAAIIHAHSHGHDHAESDHEHAITTPIATTICARPSCTSWPTRRCRCL